MCFRLIGLAFVGLLLLCSVDCSLFVQFGFLVGCLFCWASINSVVYYAWTCVVFVVLVYVLCFVVLLFSFLEVVGLAVWVMVYGGVWRSFCWLFVCGRVVCLVLLWVCYLWWSDYGWVHCAFVLVGGVVCCCGWLVFVCWFGCRFGV